LKKVFLFNKIAVKHTKLGENYAFNEQNSFKACPGTMALDLSHSRGGLSYVGRYHGAG